MEAGGGHRHALKHAIAHAAEQLVLAADFQEHRRVAEVMALETRRLHGRKQTLPGALHLRLEAIVDGSVRAAHGGPGDQEALAQGQSSRIGLQRDR